jgi:hypothetical protein
VATAPPAKTIPDAATAIRATREMLNPRVIASSSFLELLARSPSDAAGGLMITSAYDCQFQSTTDPVPTDRSITAPLGLLIVNVKVSVGPGLVIGRIGTWI